MTTRRLGFFTGVLLAAFGAVPLAAETVAEMVAQVETVVDWSGEASLGRSKIFDVNWTMDDECMVDLRVKIAEPADTPAFDVGIRGDLSDIEVDSVQFKEFEPTPRLNLDVSRGKPDWIVSSVVGADHPMFGNLKERIDGGRMGGSCDATECSINNEEDDVDIPILTGISADDGPRVVQLFQNMITLCAAK